MKLKKKSNFVKPALKKKFLTKNSLQLNQYKNFLANCKTGLRLLFLFLIRKKRILLLNPPQIIKKHTNTLKSVSSRKIGTLKKKDVIKFLSRYHLILLFSADLSNTKKTVGRGGASCPNNPSDSSRIIKGIIESGKPLLVIGRTQLVKRDYLINIAEKKENLTFFNKIAATLTLFSAKELKK